MICKDTWICTQNIGKGIFVRAYNYEGLDSKWRDDPCLMDILEEMIGKDTTDWSYHNRSTDRADWLDQ